MIVDCHLACFVGQSLDAQMTGTDEYALLIDLHSQEAGPIGESSLAELKLLERQNLQSWVEAYPEMVGGDLMLITTEFDQWELREQHVPDRLDVLMLDKDGDLLVAELKRGEASDTHQTEQPIRKVQRQRPISWACGR